MSLLDKLRELGISENLIKEIEKFRSQYPVDKEYESRIPVLAQFYYGSDVWEQAITAVLCGENLLLVGEKATGKNLFAENLAGVGSMTLCPNNICVGINVSGSHVKAVREGDTVTATARILHKGKTLHQWHIEICNGAGELISSVEITNFVMKGKDVGKPQKE